MYTDITEQDPPHYNPFLIRIDLERRIIAFISHHSTAIMISVRYSSIPNYLHDGSFYKSLNADESEGEIQIPDRCYSVDSEVQNVQDFSHLLRVTDFWGLTIIPLSVIRFCDSSSKEWIDQIKEEHSEKQCAQDLLYIFNELSDSAVTSNHKQDSSLVRAIRRERAEIVQYLALSPSEGTQANSTAAELGRLDFIQVLHQHRHSWAFDACTLATKGGHYDCLRYLHENGCHWYIPALQFAAAKGNNLLCLNICTKKVFRGTDPPITSLRMAIWRC